MIPSSLLPPPPPHTKKAPMKREDIDYMLKWKPSLGRKQPLLLQGARRQEVGLARGRDGGSAAQYDQDHVLVVYDSILARRGRLAGFRYRW